MATAIQLAPTPDQHQNFRREMGHVSRHSAVFLSGTVFTAVAGYAFKIYLARVLGADSLGLFALGMTLVGFFGVFNGLGLPQAAVRFIASYTATSDIARMRAFLVRSILLLLGANVVLGGALWLGGAWIGVHLYHTSALAPYVALFSVMMVLGAITTLLGQVMAGFKDVARRTVITNFIGGPVMMMGAVVLMSLGLGLRGYILAQIVSAMVVLMLLGIGCWKLIPREARRLGGPVAPFEREVGIFSAAVFGMNLIEFVLAQSDKILIGFYLTAREVGIYAAAAALVTFVPVILQSVNQIFASTISELNAKRDYDLLGRMHRTLTKWVLGLTVPLAMVIMLFAPTLMAIFGKGFASGWPILVIGTAGQMINCATGSVGYLLLMSGNQNRLITIQASAAAGMICLNFLLVPRLGITGAALATAISVLLTNVPCALAVRSRLGLWAYNRKFLRLVIPAAATLAVLLCARGLIIVRLSPFSAVGTALALAYGVFLVMLLALGLDHDDKLIRQAVFGRIRSVFANAEVGA